MTTEPEAIPADVLDQAKKTAASYQWNYDSNDKLANYIARAILADRSRSPLAAPVAEVRARYSGEDDFGERDVNWLVKPSDLPSGTKLYSAIPAPGTALSGTAEVEPVAISGRQVDAALEKLEEIRSLQLTRSVMLQVLQAGAIAPPAPTASPDAELVEALRDAKSAIEATVACLVLWNSNRGSPLDTEGIIARIDALLSKHGGNDA